MVCSWFFTEVKNKKSKRTLSCAVDAVSRNLFAAPAIYHTIHRARHFCLKMDSDWRKFLQTAHLFLSKF